MVLKSNFETMCASAFELLQLQMGFDEAWSCKQMFKTRFYWTSYSLGKTPKKSFKCLHTASILPIL